MKENIKNEHDIDPYQLDKASRIPSWLIILILKYWAAAAAVFFSVIGGPDIGLNIDQAQTNNDPIAALALDFVLVLFIGLFLALFINYIIRPIVRLMYNRRNKTYKFNMINMKGFKSFLVCLVYCFIISIILWYVVRFMSYHGLVFDLFGTTGGVGLEPFSYGLYFLVVDAIFLLFKNLIIMIYERIKYNRQIKGE